MLVPQGRTAELSRAPHLSRDACFAGVHTDQLWGDINLINGQPWPYLNVTASWQRFRVLNASPSRPRILMVRTAT